MLLCPALLMLLQWVLLLVACSDPTMTAVCCGCATAFPFSSLRHITSPYRRPMVFLALAGVLHAACSRPLEKEVRYSSCLYRRMLRACRWDVSWQGTRAPAEQTNGGWQVAEWSHLEGPVGAIGARRSSSRASCSPDRRNMASSTMFSLDFIHTISFSCCRACTNHRQFQIKHTHKLFAPQDRLSTWPAK